MKSKILFYVCAISIVVVSQMTQTQGDDETDLSAALSQEHTKAVHEAVDRGLRWLATQQNPDGSFKARSEVVPQTTAYALLAFLSRGHQPGQGEYGDVMTRAVDYLLSLQQSDGAFFPNFFNGGKRCHAIAGIALSEVYGFTTGPRAERIRSAIPPALAWSRQAQISPQGSPLERGGWKHFETSHAVIDASLWELMFFRSAANAGFDVPQQWVDDALEFVERCYVKGRQNQTQGVFRNSPDPLSGGMYRPNPIRTARGMLALQLHGRRDSSMVREGADWLLENSNTTLENMPIVFYSMSYTSGQAMAQAGGKYWKNYFPTLVEEILRHQSPEGNWSTSAELEGPTYCTATAILTLTLPDQLLPIHQR